MEESQKVEAPKRWQDIVLPTATTSAESELYLKYYLHQWDQVRHVENMRASITLQLLALAAGSTGGFFYIRESPELRIALSFVVTLVGCIGYFMTKALEKAADTHMDRARALRQSLGPLNTVATALKGFYPLSKYFKLVHAIVIMFGVALTVYAIAQARGYR